MGQVGLVAGQVVDLQCEGQEVDRATLEYIHVHKTAALLEASVVCGAIIGGANDDDLARLSKYSRNIGLAFQVIHGFQPDLGIGWLIGIPFEALS